MPLAITTFLGVHYEDETNRWQWMHPVRPGGVKFTVNEFTASRGPAGTIAGSNDGAISLQILYRD